MSFSKEVIVVSVNTSEIGRPTPIDQGVEVLDFGEIEPGVKLVQGRFSYDLRIVTEPGQPRISGWRAGRVLALATENGHKTLVYPKDLEEVRQPLADTLRQHPAVIAAKLVRAG